MIELLLFVAAFNLFASLIFNPPSKDPDGKVEITPYTNISFKLTFFFGLLAILF